jgi:hypothetical protein
MFSCRRIARRRPGLQARSEALPCFLAGFTSWAQGSTAGTDLPELGRDPSAERTILECMVHTFDGGVIRRICRFHRVLPPVSPAQHWGGEEGESNTRAGFRLAHSRVVSSTLDISFSRTGLRSDAPGHTYGSAARDADFCLYPVTTTSRRVRRTLRHPPRSRAAPCCVHHPDTALHASFGRIALPPLAGALKSRNGRHRGVRGAWPYSWFGTAQRDWRLNKVQRGRLRKMSRAVRTLGRNPNS